MTRPRSENLHLIGLRGAGKSTLGPLIAGELNWAFVDSDSQLTHQMGMSIRDAFSAFGEVEFRRKESILVEKLCEGCRQVIAWGGGVAVDRNNRKLLKRSGLCVWLKASPEILWRRLQGDPSTAEQRPALTDLDGLSELRQLMDSRNDAYVDCADFSVNVEDGLIDDLATEIAQWFQMSDKFTK